MGTLTVSREWLDQIEAWEEELRAARRPATTRGLRTYHLRRLGHDHPKRGPWTMEHADLVQWLADHDWAASTARSYRTSLRVFYRWAHAVGRIPTNPAALLPAITPARALPRPAADDAVRVALRSADPRVRLMVSVLVQTGMRRGELAHLRPTDVEGHPGDWCLRVLGKGDRERLVPIPDVLAAQVRAMPGPWCWPTREGDGPLTPAHVGVLVSRALPEGVTAHNLRHRYASVAYALDHDLRAVQELLGHASVATTQVYTRVGTSSMRRAAIYAGTIAA